MNLGGLSIPRNSGEGRRDQGLSGGVRQKRQVAAESPLPLSKPRGGRAGCEVQRREMRKQRNPLQTW